MNERKTRDKLLALAYDHVDAHAQEFDSTDPGLFWGNALRQVLGGPDYLAFEQVSTPAGEVIGVLPIFGKPVHPGEFTPEQLGTVVMALGEIEDAAPTSDGVAFGSEEWILSFAVRATAGAGGSRIGAHPGNPPIIAEALFVTAFWLLNTTGGLLDLTGIGRPRRSSSAPSDAGESADEADDDPVV